MTDVHQDAIEAAARALAEINKAIHPDPQNWMPDARAAIAAYLSALWRPIASAPKDGRLCMFWSPRGGTFVAPSVEMPTRDAVRQMSFAIHKDSGEWPDAGYNPTHWRPLPAPPGDTK